MLMWMRNLADRKQIGAGTSGPAEHPDAITQLEDRIKGGLGNPAMLPIYRQDAARLRELNDDELVYIDRLHPGLGAAAELSRRNMEATRDLTRSLSRANSRLYALTVVLGLYTVALLVATIVLVLNAH